jgi:predicted GIY-YIG superfamily endonuclease
MPDNMDASSGTEVSTPCWIYILLDRKEMNYQIGYTLNLPERMKQVNGKDTQLVYLRKFDDANDAIGHKLFLEEISRASLQRIIRMYKKERGSRPYHGNTKKGTL